MKDKAGEAGLEDERGTIQLHRWLWQRECVREVFYKKLPGAQRCPVCLEVCWKHPWPALPLSRITQFSALVRSSQIAAKSGICCCSGMDGEPA